MENFLESYARKYDLKFEYKFEEPENNYSNMAVKIPNTGFTIQRTENTPLIEYRLIKGSSVVWSMEGSQEPTETKIHSLIRLLRKPLKQMKALCNKVHGSQLIGAKIIWGQWVSMYFDVEAGTFEVSYTEEDLNSTPPSKLTIKKVFKSDEFEKAEALFLKLHLTKYVLNIMSKIFKYLEIEYRFIYDTEAERHLIFFRTKIQQNVIKLHYSQIDTIDLWILENGVVNHEVFSIHRELSSYESGVLWNELTCWILTYLNSGR